MINGLVTDFPTEDLIDRIRLLDNNKLCLSISPSLQCLREITGAFDATHRWESPSQDVDHE